MTGRTLGQQLAMDFSDLRTEVSSLRVAINRLSEQVHEQAEAFAQIYERLDKIERRISGRPPSGAFRVDEEEPTAKHRRSPKRPSTPPKEPGS